MKIYGTTSPGLSLHQNNGVSGIGYRVSGIAVSFFYFLSFDFLIFTSPSFFDDHPVSFFSLSLFLLLTSLYTSPSGQSKLFPAPNSSICPSNAIVIPSLIFQYNIYLILLLSVPTLSHPAYSNTTSIPSLSLRCCLYPIPLILIPYLSRPPPPDAVYIPSLFFQSRLYPVPLPPMSSLSPPSSNSVCIPSPSPKCRLYPVPLPQMPSLSRPSSSNAVSIRPL